MTGPSGMTQAELEHKTTLVMTLGRMLDRCIPGENGCVEWTGCVNSRGYGVIDVRGKRKLTHRVSYEAHIGPIPDGLQIDHLCRNKLCVHPNHLEPVTDDENKRRASVARTHCKHGHEYTPENTIIKKRRNGGTIRNCRSCNNEQQRVRALARRLAADRPAS